MDDSELIELYRAARLVKSIHCLARRRVQGHHRASQRYCLLQPRPIEDDALSDLLSVSAAADVRAKRPFQKNATPLHHQSFAFSRSRHRTSCQVVARDHALDFLDKVFAFGRTMGLGTV